MNKNWNLGAAILWAALACKDVLQHRWEWVGLALMIFEVNLMSYRLKRDEER